MVRVRSEIASLTRVIVHKPGTEVEQMTPSTAQELLYNDIVPLEAVQSEHDGLVAALNDFAQVDQLQVLLASALDDTLARERAARTFYPGESSPRGCCASVGHTQTANRPRGT